jgi:hypothetical protein
VGVLVQPIQKVLPRKLFFPAPCGDRLLGIYLGLASLSGVIGKAALQNFPIAPFKSNPTVNPVFNPSWVCLKCNVFLTLQS